MMEFDRLVGHPIIVSEYIQRDQVFAVANVWPGQSPYVAIHPLTFISFKHRYGSSPWDPIAELTELLEWRIQDRLKELFSE